MAIEKRGVLKNHFKTGKYPTEQQFANALDSYVHKNDTIEMSSVAGLIDAINGKADKATIDLKDYAETGKVLPMGGCYLHYGMPTHARTLDAFDTDFDPDAPEGDTTQVVAFCCGHGDGTRSGKGSIYLVYGKTASGYAYYARFTGQDVPDDILRAFGEAPATTTADGLMSASDKVKLDALPTNAQLTKTLNGKASTAVATTSKNGLMSIADKVKLDGLTVDLRDYLTTSTTLPIGAYIYTFRGEPVSLETIELPVDDETGEISDSMNFATFYMCRMWRTPGPDETVMATVYLWAANGKAHSRYADSTMPQPLKRALYYDTSEEVNDIFSI